MSLRFTLWLSWIFFLSVWKFAFNLRTCLVTSPSMYWTPLIYLLRFSVTYVDLYVQWFVHRVLCVNSYPKICNNVQFIYICKLLYTFQVVSPPIIRSSYHCIYSNGLNYARYCRYSNMSSWWWVGMPPETCRAVWRCK